MSDPATWFLLAMFALLLAAAVWDATTLTIPNYLVLAVLGAYVGWRALGFDVSALLFDLLAAAIVFAVCFAMFALNWLGGGDAKLAPAAALWIGIDGLLEFAIAMTFAGGVLAIVLLALRFALARAVAPERLPPVLRARAPVPYGIAISFGALLVLWLQHAARLSA